MTDRLRIEFLHYEGRLSPAAFVAFLRLKPSRLRYPLVEMTKVELTFGLTRTVTEADMTAISRTYSVYGIQAVKLSPSLDSVTVGFDASRLTEQSLENALIRCGIPLQRKDLPIGPSA